MIIWWVAQLGLLGGLLAVAAFGAESALRIARRPTRWVWAGAMGLTLALGALAPTRLATTAVASRAWSAAARTTDAVAAESSTNLFAMARDRWGTATSELGAQVQLAWTAWHRVMPESADRWLLIAWLAASLALLVACVAVHVRYQRRRARWPLGVVRGTTVRIAHDTGPAVIGVTSAEIVIPKWLLTRDDREQQLVLEHELEHVRQHDPLLLAAAQVAVILLPWHPAVWWMASRLRLAIELDCDRRVLQRGANARDYGTLLIDLTDHRTGFGAALPAFSCSPSHLERRLVAMTPTHLKYPLARLLATGAFASLALLAACEAKLPTADEMDNMTASSATTTAGRVAMIDTARVVYFIDGQSATKADAEKLSAERIASVNVLQKGMQSGGEVRIVTREGARSGDSTSSARIEYVRTDPSATVTFVTPGDSLTLRADAATKRADESAVSIAPAGSLPRVRAPGGAPPSDAPSSARIGFTGLMVLDGKITDPAVVNNLSRNEIESVNIVKGAAATALYNDPRAANGVIMITTKRAKI
jgi:TonB-dependent SusC/RagA subfamily outer membrane receptor